jgi:cytochrome c-type biogenesis protein CcmH
MKSFVFERNAGRLDLVRLASCIDRGRMLTDVLRTTRRVFAAMVLMSAAFTATAPAATPDEVLADPALETRARTISQTLRCVVCQNQSIDDSNAPLAHDLRVLVRDRLVAGDTDQQTVAFIVARYGNFVLLNPPMQLNTLALWAGPAFFLLLAAIGFGRYVGRWSSDQASPTTQLSKAEQRRIEELLRERSSI